MDEREQRVLHAFKLRSDLWQQLFHFIPGVTESFTRLPPGAPIAASAEAAIFPPIYGSFVLLFLIVVGLQFNWLRKRG